MGKNKRQIIQILKNSLDFNKLNKIKNSIKELKKDLDNSDWRLSEPKQIQQNEIVLKKEYLKKELEQIIETKTIERTKYYINRLIKGITEIRTGKINDINLNRWKEYDDIITDSLWVLNKRDNSGAHSAGYWGNFIPQIPNQFLRRFTKKDEWVLDTFLGSGTTLIECKRLGRNGIGIELQKNVVNLAKENVNEEKNNFDSDIRIINADSTELDYKKELKKIGIDSVQFLIMHPPYWDIIKFSEDKKDLSNASSVNEFLSLFGKIIDKTIPILDKGRFLAVVIGDKYVKGEWIPLGFYTMQEVLKRNYKLKSTIVKNFEDTTAKRNQKSLWKYRALVGGFYIFKHEYIFLFQKR
ncbi:MAG: DNA methyltransferase [Candidatus Marinimicrobia bacterium]|jgi:DNA modification methylase|nr:DNA methyltransferase [Candidatus Neomarinimicrobiota bacterium]